MLVAAAAVSRVNFLGDMVLGQVEKAVNEQLRAEVSLSPLTGNPVRGFKGTELSILRSGDVLVYAGNVAIDIHLPSLLTGSPRVGQLTLDGLRSDYASILKLLPEKGAETGPTDIPINKIVLNKSELGTPLGLLELDDSSVRPKNTEWFELDLSGVFASVPAALSGRIQKKDGNWALDGVRLGLADGTAELSGSAFPELDLKLGLKNIDLTEVAKIFPNLDKVMIHGSVTGEMKVKGLGSDLTIDGAGALKNALIAGIPLTEIDAEWKYSKNLIDLKINKGSVFDSSVDGYFRLDSTGSTPYLTLNAKISGLDFNDWTDNISDNGRISAALGEARAAELKHIRGAITSLDANIKGPLNALVGSISLAPSSLGYKTAQITDIKGETIFTGKPSGDVSFSALYKNNKMTLEGSLSFAKNTQTNLRFNTGALALDELMSVIGDMENFKPSGSVGISAVISGVFGEWAARGDVTSARITEARYGNFENVKLSPEYRFKDKSLALSQSSAEWNGARITLSGGLTQETGQKLDFSGTFSNAETLSFEALVPVLKTLQIDAALSGKFSVGGTLSAPAVAAEVSASRAKFRKIGIDGFSAKLDYVTGKLTLEPLDIRIGRGGANLSAAVLFPRDAGGAYLPVVWSVDGTLANIPGEVLKEALDSEEPFTGAVSGAVKAGNAGGPIEWSFDALGKNVGWREFKAEEAKGKLRGSSEVIEIDDMRVSFLRGESVVNGRVTLAEAGQPVTDGTLDLTVEIKKLNVYELLRKHIPAVRGFQGLVESRANITGTLGDPRIDGKGTVAPLRFRSFLLPMVDMEFSGGIRDISSEVTARLHDGELKGKARLWLNKDKWNAEASVDGKKINLNQIGRYLPEGFREKLAGNANLSLTGGGSLGSFSGKGTFTSDHMQVMGVEINDIFAPFYVADGYAIVEDVKAESSGGEVSGGIAFDLRKDRWGGNLTVLSADIATFLSQSVPELPGSVSGKGDFKVRAGGEMGRMSSVRASGVMRLYEGTLSGFKAVEAAQKFTHGNPLRFDLVQANFDYAGGFLTILPGSQAIAPKNDPVYRYMMLDGTVDENGVFGLFTMGKANIQALNALLGAIQGLMDMDINFNEPLDKAELLQGIIGGALTGFSRSDFRFVTMGIRGTYDAPRFENIRVQSSSKSASDAIPKTPSDPKDDAFSNGNKTFKFRFEIPVGPGSSTGSELDGQARGQILKNALDSLLRNADF